nr:type II toxin-antitoxin system RelE/ParE family toxin [uncultured Albidiferax sp.]
MNYGLHPEAAREHKQQVAFYEDAEPGLGRRYHAEFLAAVQRACAAPQQARVVLAPDVRRIPLKVFHFQLIYRAVEGSIQVLAVAHYRRQPAYWAGRLDPSH